MRKSLREVPQIKTPEQTARAMSQREANQQAREAGLPLPHPNPWDKLDPTKLPEDATPEQITQRYKDFCQICPPPKRIEYTL